MGKKSTKTPTVPAVKPFLSKCYDMVDDESTDEVISWSQTNSSFVIWDATQLTVQLLPKYFKHSNFSSFMRQLHTYGFKKIDSDRWEFANNGFVRGQKHLLMNIIRRKNVQALDHHTSSQQTTGTCEDGENNSLLKEVEILKTDKNLLMQGLVKLRQHHEMTESKVLRLRDRLQRMEKNQQQMLSFLVMAMQNTGFLVQLLQGKEINWCIPETGKTMLQEVTGDGDSAASDRMIVTQQLQEVTGDVDSAASDKMIVRLQCPKDTDATSLHTRTSKSEEFPEFNFPSDIPKDFFMNVDFLTVPADEQNFSLESHGQITLPDVAEDELLRQMLLAAPFIDRGIDPNPNSGEPTDFGVEQESADFEAHLGNLQSFEALTEEMEKSEHLDMDSAEESKELALLTEQIELLISGNQ